MERRKTRGMKVGKIFEALLNKIRKL